MPRIQFQRVWKSIICGIDLIFQQFYGVRVVLEGLDFKKLVSGNNGITFHIGNLLLSWIWFHAVDTSSSVWLHGGK
jgi:hypothetical protein